MKTFFQYEKQRVRALLVDQLRPIFDVVRIKCTFDEWVDALVTQTLEWSIDFIYEAGQRVKHVSGMTGVIISDHNFLTDVFLDGLEKALDPETVDPEKTTVRVKWSDNTIADCRPNDLEAQQ